MLEYTGDVSDLDVNFQISYEYYGAKETHDLVPNGPLPFMLDISL